MSAKRCIVELFVFLNERNLQNKKKSTTNTIKISILDAINLIVMEKLWQIC